MEKEYYTIQEFAELVGTTKTNIYNQLGGRLKPYLIVIDGKKHITAAAASTFYSIKLKRLENADTVRKEQPNDIENNSTANNENIPLNSTEINHFKPLNSTDDTTKELIDTLKQQLAIQNETISRLNSLLEKEQENTAREQQLRLLAEQKILSLEKNQQAAEQEQKTTDTEETKGAEQTAADLPKGFKWLMSIFKKK